MTILLALFALAQEEVTIPRTARDVYARSVPDAERAAGLADSDPQGALDILDPIIDNSRLEKRECRIRWELFPGTYSRYYDFFPHQARGKAYLKLAEKAKADPDKARGYLERALKDFQASKDLGVKASENLLQEARRRLAALGQPGGAAKEFEGEWGKLIDAGQFSQAGQLLDSPKGKELNDAERKAFLDDTNEKCRLYADAAAQRFLRNLRLLSTPRQVEIMTPEAFDRDFSPPDRNTLVDAGLLPELLWCLSVRPTLDSLRQKKDVLEPLLRHAVEAVPLAARNFDWFGSVEGLAHEIARARISERADQAQEAPADRRGQLREEAGKIESRWKAFEEEVRRAAAGKQALLAQLPSRSFAPIMGRFPTDVDVGKEMLEGLLKSAEAPDPDRALAEILARIDQLEAAARNLSVESRRELLRYRIVAGALRGLLAGGAPDRMAADLRLRGADYKAAGGTADEARFGPKVHQVFRLLVK